MAHFRAVISGGRGVEVSRLGHKDSGIRIEAQSWQGKVVIYLEHDLKTGQDVATVYLARHSNAGTSQELYNGPVGGEMSK